MSIRIACTCRIWCALRHLPTFSGSFSAVSAERVDDPVRRLILLRMAREWMEDAAAIASTLAEPESKGSRAPSGNRAA